MSRTLPFSCCLLAVLTACDPSVAVTDPAVEVALSASAVAPPMLARTVRGSCVLAFTPPSPIGGGLLRQTDEGTCVLSVMGRTHFTGELVLNPVAGTQTGTRTLTAANGDRLELAVQGTSRFVPPGFVHFEAEFTVLGGTGRFADATGSLTGSGIADMASRQSTVDLDGRVTFAASDRR